MPFQHAIEQLQKDEKAIRIFAEMPSGPDQGHQIRQANDIENAITFLKVANLGGMSALISLIRQWGMDRNIIGPNAKATVHTQFEKLREEFMELEDAIARENKHELVDAIGDCTVVLILLAELAGVRFDTCLVAAFEEIKDRKGSMIDGCFVKTI